MKRMSLLALICASCTFVPPETPAPVPIIEDTGPPTDAPAMPCLEVQRSATGEARLTASFTLDGHRRQAVWGYSPPAVDFESAEIFDDAWRVVEDTSDSDVDGVVDWCTLTTYANNGKIATSSWVYGTCDDDADGAMLYSYDSAGFLIQEQSLYDGNPPRVTGYTNDEHGNPVHVLTDYDSDGVIDVDVTYEYTYDGDHATEVAVLHDDGTRTVDRAITYDSGGRILTVQVAGDDGVLFEQQAYTYDESGRVTRFVSHVWDSEGIFTYAYDDLGRLVSDAWFNVDTEEPYGSTDHSYECE